MLTYRNLHSQSNNLIIASEIQLQKSGWYGKYYKDMALLLVTACIQKGATKYITDISPCIGS